MKRFAERDRQPELMDQPDLDEQAHTRALAGLGTTNRVCGIARTVWHSIRRALAGRDSRQPIRILDIASGGGDILRRIALLAARDRIAIEPHGCDISETSIEFAQDSAQRAGVHGARFFRLDALKEPLPAGYDVVMSTLFLHHLETSQAQDLLARMAQAARRLVLIDDLRRTSLGYLYAWFGGRLLTQSPIVHVDGPLSVRSAFSVAEVSQLATAAGLTGATIRTHWPQRFQLIWNKT